MITATFVVWLVFAIFAMHADGGPVPSPDGDMTAVSRPTVVLGNAATDLIVASLKAKLKREHGRYLAAHSRVRQLTRTLQHRTTVREAIDLACSIYGNCSTLWRRAQCESQLNPFARSASGANGLLQFLPSTWSSTPFARFSVWSPYANAMAAGWMMAHGRGGEWVCR